MNIFQHHPTSGAGRRIDRFFRLKTGHKKQINEVNIVIVCNFARLLAKFS